MRGARPYSERMNNLNVHLVNGERNHRKRKKIIRVVLDHLSSAFTIAPSVVSTQTRLHGQS
jgi:hypothetical protein